MGPKRGALLLGKSLKLLKSAAPLILPGGEGVGTLFPSALRPMRQKKNSTAGRPSRRVPPPWTFAPKTRQGLLTTAEAFPALQKHPHGGGQTPASSESRAKGRRDAKNSVHESRSTQLMIAPFTVPALRARSEAPRRQKRV